MFFLFSVFFVALPDRKDALLYQATDVKPVIEASGSSGFLQGDSNCIPTYPNQTLVGNQKMDWCSNILPNNQGHPWIQYSFPNKAIKLTGYAIRNGCCYYYDCCCNPETGDKLDYYCCCRLYSFSLLGSNDNKTWVTLHKVEQDKKFYYCKLNTYEIQTSQSFKFIRFVLDEPWPGCPNCMQINQIELYGQTITSFSTFDTYEGDDSDESISIIGKVKRE